jgi:LDH2 family malate/lactate/ureidoglycolate dehydrogenase
MEFLREQERRVSGIDVDDATWATLRKLAVEHKVEHPTLT